MIKATDVANYFLSLVEPDDDECISNLKLQKLCYYAQGFYLALYGERLFNESIEAWQHGPVIPTLYHKYKDHGRECLIPDRNFEINSIPENVRELLNEIYANYGQYSAWRLREMTHQEAPWLNTYNKTTNNIISDSKLRDFFCQRLA